MEENRKKKKLYFYSFIISVLAISVVVLFGLLVNMSNTAESLAISLIDRTTKDANSNFDNYFDRLKGNLLATKQLCDQGIIDASMNAENEPYFLPIINNYPQVNTIALVHTNGHECSLINEDTMWMSNVVYETQDSGMVIERTRWKGDLFNKEIIKEWSDYNSAYDPRTRPWYNGAMTNAFPEEPWWTDPYVFYTVQKPGITATIKSINPTTNQTNIIFYDILLSEISDFTINEQASANGKTFVMTKDLKVIGLPHEPHLSSSDSISKYVLKGYEHIGSEVLTEVVNEWKQLPSDNNDNAYDLVINGEKWWVKISPFILGKNKVFLVGVAVPENDFLTEVNKSRNVVIGGFLIVLIIVLIVVRQYMLKNKMNIQLTEQKLKISNQKDKIEEQKQIVEKAHHEVQASINYAERIQNALLDGDESWDRIGSEQAILFRPRDVVSGDFYWAFANDEMAIWAASDCTGHGVPGAFMSMLGMGFLNEIVGEGGETNAGNILNQLRSKILKSLKQKGDEQRKDGMDIALCVLNKKSNVLQFAGAYNPLLVIRKNDKMLEGYEKMIEGEDYNLFEFKADKMPIGKHIHDQKEFSTIEVQLQKGDVIYTFTDGFQDQFGGENGKKYMIKRMKNYILSIQDVTMEEQKELLNKEFEQWMQVGNTKQIDDVCIVGVKI